MATEVCEVSSGYAAFSDSLHVTLVPPPLAEAGFDFTDRATLALGVQLSDASGAFSAALESNSAAYVVETPDFSESIIVLANVIAHAHDGSGRLAAALRMFWTEELEVTAEFSETIFAGQPLVALLDTGHLSDAAGPFGVSSRLSDAAAFADSMAAAKAALLEDEAHFSDGAIATIPMASFLQDGDGSFAAEAEAVVRTQPSLSEGGRFSVAVEHVAQMSAAVEDEANFSDFAGSGLGGAWTASTDTFAMSRWEGEPFNSIAEIDGELYAASESGLYRLERGAQQIDASIRGGLSDFNDGTLKHASYFYCAYTSSGRLRLVVGYAPNGVEESSEYELPARAAAGAPTPNRVKVGRGMRSRYWRTTLGNVGGADFTFHGGHLVVDGSSRRV